MHGFDIELDGWRLSLYHSRWKPSAHVHSAGKVWDSRKGRYTCTVERYEQRRMEDRWYQPCHWGFAIDCVLGSGHRGECLSSSGFTRDMTSRVA